MTTHCKKIFTAVLLASLLWGCRAVRKQAAIPAPNPLQTIAVEAPQRDPSEWEPSRHESFQLEPSQHKPSQRKPSKIDLEIARLVEVLQGFLHVIQPSELSSIAQINHAIEQIRNTTEELEDMLADHDRDFPSPLSGEIDHKLEALEAARASMLAPLQIEELKAWWWLARVYDQMGAMFAQQAFSKRQALTAWNDARMAYARVIVRVNRVTQETDIPAEEMASMTRLKQDAQTAYYRLKEQADELETAVLPDTSAASNPIQHVNDSRMNDSKINGNSVDANHDVALVLGPGDAPYQWHPLVLVPPVDGMTEFAHNGRFGADRINRRGRKRKHKGVDVLAKRGSVVRAVAGGKVIFAGTRGGYGKVVVVRHPEGYLTIYAHNKRNLIGPQQTVEAGTPIAEVGRTGNVLSKGPTHLHFEVRQNSPNWQRSVALNPLFKSKERLVNAKRLPSPDTLSSPTIQKATLTSHQQSVSALDYFKAQLQVVGNELRSERPRSLELALQQMLEAYHFALARYPGIPAAASSNGNGPSSSSMQSLGETVQRLHDRGYMNRKP